MGDMSLVEVLVYLHNTIVFGETLEQNECLEKVLIRFHEEGLNLLLEKIQFYQLSVTYLDHIVTNSSKLEAIISWPRPQNVADLRSFLEFCSYC